MNLMDLVATLRLEVSGFLAGIQQAQGGMVSITQGSQNLGTILTANLESFEKLGANMQSFGIRATAVGGILTGTVTVPLEKLAEAALDMGSRFQQAEIALTTMTGSGRQAKQFLEELKAFAASTPFQFPDLVVSATRMRALGFATEAVIPMLRTIGDAAGALGKNQAGIDAITTAFGRMLERGIVSAREMNMLATQGIASWDILAKELNMTIPELMVQVRSRSIEAVQAIPALLKGMNDLFQDQMQKQMDTFAGQWSNFKEKLSFVLGNLGTALIPFAKVFAEWGQSVLVVIDNVVKGFGQLPMPVQGIALAMTALVAAVGPLLAIFGTFIGVLGFVVSGLSSLSIAMGYKTLGAAVLALSEGFSGLMVALTPAAVVITAIAAAWALWQLGPVRESVLAVGEAINTVYEATLKPFVDIVVEAAKRFTEFAQAAISSGLQGFWTSLTEAGNKVHGSFTDLIGAFGPLREGFGKLLGAVSDFLSPLKPLFDILTQIAELIGETMLVSAIKVMGITLKAVADFIAGGMKSALDLLKKGIDVQTEGMGQLAEMLKTVTDRMKTWADQIQGSDWFKSLVSGTSAWREQLSGLVGNLTGTSAKIDESKQMTDGLVASVKDARLAYEQATAELAKADAQYQKTHDNLQAVQDAANKVVQAKTYLKDITADLTPFLEKEKEEIKAAREEYDAAKKNLDDYTAAIKDGKPVQTEYAAAQERMRVATKDLKDITSLLKPAVEASGGSMAEFSGTLKDAIPIIQQGVAHTTNLSTKAKQLGTDVEDAGSKIKKGMGFIGEGADEATLLETAMDDLTDIVKRSVSGINDSLKSVGQTWKGMAEIVSKTVDVSPTEDAFGSLAEAMREFTDIIQNETTQSVGEDLSKTVDQVVDLTQEMVEFTTVLTSNVTFGIGAVNKAFGDGIQIVEEYNHGTVDAMDAVADKVKTTADDVKQNWWDAWLDASKAVEQFVGKLTRIIDSFGQGVGKALWESMFGDKRNDQLDKQAADLRTSLAERTAEWEQYKTDVTTKIGEITASHAEHLAQELADLQAQMDAKQQEWEDYQKQAQESLAQFTAKQDEQLQTDIGNLLDNLADRTAAWQKYQVDAQAGLEDFTAKQDAQLESQRSDLLSNLADRATAWQKYQADAAAGLAEFTAKQDATLADQKQGYLNDLKDRAEADTDYRNQQLEKLEEFKEAQADKLSKDLTELQNNLDDKRDEYNSYVSDVNEKLANLQGDSDEKLASDLEKLKASFSDKLDAYEAYVADVNQKLSRVGEDLAEQVDDQKRSTQRSLDDKKTALERDERDINEKIDRELAKGDKANQDSIVDWRQSLADKEADYQTYVQRSNEDLNEFVDDHQKAYQRQTEDLQEQLDERTKAQKEAKDDYDKNVADTTNKAATELARQTQDLQKSLAARTKDWNDYQADTARKVSEAQAAYYDAIAKEQKSVSDSLAARAKDWDKYQADIADKITAAQKKHDEAIDDQKKKVADGLADQREAWEKYQADIADKIAALQKKHDDAIAENYKKVTDALNDQAVAYAKYQDDIAEKIAAAQKKHDDAITAETEKVQKDLQKRLAAYNDYMSALFAKQSQARDDEAKAQAKDLDALAKQLHDKQVEYDKYVADINKRLGELADEHQTFWDKVGAAGVKAMESIFGAILSLGIKEFFSWLNDKGLFDGLKDALKDAIGALTSAFSGAWEAIKGGFTTFAGWIWDGIKAIGSKIAGLFTQAGTDALSTAGNAASNAAGGASGVTGGISQAVAGGVAGVVGAVGSVVSAISGVIGNFQMHSMNETLSLIEENTRYVSISMIMPRGVVQLMDIYLPKLEGMETFNYDILAPTLADIDNNLTQKLDRVVSSIIIDLRNEVIGVKDYLHDVIFQLIDVNSNLSTMVQTLGDVASGLIFLEETFSLPGGSSGSSSGSSKTMFTVDVHDLNKALEDISGETRDVGRTVMELGGNIQRVYDIDKQSFTALEDSQNSLRSLSDELTILAETAASIDATSTNSYDMFSQAGIGNILPSLDNLGITSNSILSALSDISSYTANTFQSMATLPNEFRNALMALDLVDAISSIGMSIQVTMAAYDTRGTMANGFNSVTSAIYSLQSVFQNSQNAQIQAIYSLASVRNTPTPTSNVTINVQGQASTSTRTDTGLSDALRRMGIPT